MPIAITIAVTCLALWLGSGVALALDKGDKAPELRADKWLNTNAVVTLRGLSGSVVVVEFWATWCPPCRASIPHLIELNNKYEKDGVVFIGLTNEDYRKAKIAKFVNDMKMNYIIGTGSDTGRKYGVKGIPAAFVIGRDGRVRWNGHPMSGLARAIDLALAPAEDTPAPVVTSAKKPQQPAAKPRAAGSR